MEDASRLGSTLSECIALKLENRSLEPTVELEMWNCKFTGSGDLTWTLN